MSFQNLSLVFGVLFGVLTLIGAGAKLFRLSSFHIRPGPGRALMLCESIALDPRRRIHLVQCGQRRVLLLTGGGQDLVIGWLPEP